MWLQFYSRQTMAVLIGGLEEAFAFFGGVPVELLFDQMKSVIIEDKRASGGKLLENAEFMRFAAHWGFRIPACRPYRAKTKGKVERPIGYVRESFLYGRHYFATRSICEPGITVPSVKRWSARRWDDPSGSRSTT
jgi:transposase